MTSITALIDQPDALWQTWEQPTMVLLPERSFPPLEETYLARRRGDELGTLRYRLNDDGQGYLFILPSKDPLADVDYAYLLAWGIAALQEHAECKAIVVRPHGQPALAQACSLLGLQPGSTARQANRWSRPIAAPPPLLARRWSYSWVQSENIIRQQRALALLLAALWREAPGVDLVLGLGSLARDVADPWSSLELAVCAWADDLRRFRPGTYRLGSTTVELSTLRLEELGDRAVKSWSWTSRQRYAESVVLADRSGLTRGRLAQALPLSQDDRVALASGLLLALGAEALCPPSWDGTFRYGQHWCFAPHQWVVRGAAASAHALLNRASEPLLKLLFVLNSECPPAEPWRRPLAKQLHWKPDSWEILFGELELGDRSHKSAMVMARARAFGALLEALAARAEEQRLIAPDLAAFQHERRRRG